VLESAATRRGEPFVFIVGCGRSGTTLLRLMIDSHPDIAIPPESYFSPRVPRTAAARGGAVDAERLRSYLSEQRWFRRWGMTDGTLREALPGGATFAYGDALRRVYRGYAAEQGKPRYANKTPDHVLMMPSLLRLFPEARFVHIVRDGRDVALSLGDVRFGPDDVAGAARYWRLRVERGRAAGASLGTERYREVRYEDLIADPPAMLRSLCSFIGIRYDDAMLSYPDRAGERVVGAALRAVPTTRNVTRPPTAGLRDWRSQMPSRDVVVWEAVAGRTLSAFGYASSGQAIPISMRATTRARAGTDAAIASANDLRLRLTKRGLRV
jgi:Sulfotransferase family